MATKLIPGLAAVPGLSVGHAHDDRLMSGCSVVIGAEPFVAAVDIRGGATGTRETDAIGLAGTVEEAHAIVLSGGSAFGLAAASGVHSWLAARGIGFAVGRVRVPIVPAAILFDLLNGGDKAWGEHNPYEALGRAACGAANHVAVSGSVGAGFGATTAAARGGLGQASARTADGVTVAAMAAVNPVGSVTIGDGPHFWAAMFEQDGEFGGLGFPAPLPRDATVMALKGVVEPTAVPQNTTIAIVATGARLSKREAHRLAVMAQTGLARAIYPVHTPLDGDVVFAIATGSDRRRVAPADLARLGALAANTLSRAVARAVYAADPAPPGWTGPPAYCTRFHR